jgi:general secretion pathway protein B
MSYILDALRRADAERERERGGVPGLHTQALPAPGLEPASTRTLPGWAWGAIGVAAGLLVALGAWLGLRTPPADAPAPVSNAAAPAAVPPVAAPSVTAPASAVPAAPAVTSPPVAPAVAAKPPPRATAIEAPPRPASPASVSAAPVLPFERLPEDVRRQLPRLAVDGSVYSEQHAQRILIIGGQLFHEGDAVAPGVVLERIEPKSAVLRWHDWRYTIAY